MCTFAETKPEYNYVLLLAGVKLFSYPTKCEKKIREVHTVQALNIAYTIRNQFEQCYSYSLSGHPRTSSSFSHYLHSFAFLLRL